MSYQNIVALFKTFFTTYFEVQFIAIKFVSKISCKQEIYVFTFCKQIALYKDIFSLTQCNYNFIELFDIKNYIFQYLRQHTFQKALHKLENYFSF